MSDPLTIVRRYDATELEAGSDGRTIIGRCVPFGRPARVCDPGGTPYVEVIARGAFARCVRQPHRVLLNYEHGRSIVDVIGHATELVEDDDGLRGVFRAIDGLSGDQALELIRSDAVTGLSVEALVARNGSRRLEDGTIERYRISRLEHVALTSSPAYADAGILALRSAPDAGPLALDEVRARNDELRRRPRWDA